MNYEVHAQRFLENGEPYTVTIRFADYIVYCRDEDCAKTLLKLIQ